MAKTKARAKAAKKADAAETARPEPKTNLLLCVAGKTPATITEALWALGVQNGVAVHGLRILTTADAAATLRETLPDALDNLRRDYPGAFSQLRFNLPEDLRLARGPRGKSLSDIRTDRDNQALADWILAEVAEVCSQPALAVHASLAGGRKTMSFLLGSAMQLVGRGQDHLYHVLVPEEYEVPGFLYPTPGPHPLKGRNNRQLDAANARVDLSEIAFVRLAFLFPNSDLGALLSNRSFSDLVARADNTLAGPSLEVHVYRTRDRDNPRPRLVFVDPASGRLLVEKAFQKLDSLEFVIYTYLLKERLVDAKLGYIHEPRPIPIFRLDSLRESLLHLKEWVARLVQGDPLHENRDASLYTTLQRYLDNLLEGDKDYEVAQNFYKADLGPRISRFNRELSGRFEKDAPCHDPNHYLIQGLGHHVRNLKGCWYLNIPPDYIHFHPPLPD